jgi:hypothetical protein
MKPTISLLLLLFVTQANATCLDTVLDNLRHPTQSMPTAEQLECIENNPEVESSLMVLCSDNMNISSKYERYRFYEKKHKKLWSDFASTRDPFILNQINTNKMEWSAGGYRAEINSALEPVMQVEYSCRSCTN